MRDGPRGRDAEHEELREWAGAYVVGALEAHERARFASHLDGCATCQREVSDLAPLTTLLSRAATVAPTPPPERVVQSAISAVHRDWEQLQASRKRWRATAVAAVAAAAVAVSSLVIGLRPPETAATWAVRSTGSVTGEVSLQPKPWGTQVRLDLAGLPQRRSYTAWLSDRSGERVRVTSWGSTPQGGAVVVGATALSPDQIRAVTVTSEEVSDVLGIGASSSRAGLRTADPETRGEG